MTPAGVKYLNMYDSCRSQVSPIMTPAGVKYVSKNGLLTYELLRNAPAGAIGCNWSKRIALNRSHGSNWEQVVQANCSESLPREQLGAIGPTESLRIAPAGAIGSNCS